MDAKWAVRVHQTQEMKGKEDTGDPGGADAKSGSYSSGSGLCPSGENGFFADVELDDLCQSVSGPNYPDRRSPHMLERGPDPIRLSRLC